jgi:putative ABC transport system substrate-binding protein
MSRRNFLIAIGAMQLAAPLATFAQQRNKVWRIGVLSTAPSGKDAQFEALKQQLRELQHVEGKTAVFDYVSAEEKYERLPALAADLVRRNVDVIVTFGGTPAITAARNGTSTIPLVFTGVGDPVGQGIVDSLARPGGNATGATVQHRESASKRVAFLKELVPSAKRIAILRNPDNSATSLEIQETQTAARTLRLELTVVNARAAAEFEKAFAEIAQDRPAGLIILSDGIFGGGQAKQLMELAAKHRLPTIGATPSVPQSGGLMSYGANRAEVIRRAAALVDKVLKGAKPADLPVEQPTKFDLILNMKTAKALGITIPQTILVQVTKVIE